MSQVEKLAVLLCNYFYKNIWLEQLLRTFKVLVDLTLRLKFSVKKSAFQAPFYYLLCTGHSQSVKKWRQELPSQGLFILSVSKYLHLEDHKDNHLWREVPRRDTKRIAVVIIHTLCQSALSRAALKSDNFVIRHPYWDPSHWSCCHFWKPAVWGDSPHWDWPWGQACMERGAKRLAILLKEARFLV